jgi:hypothetical protein
MDEYYGWVLSFGKWSLTFTFVTLSTIQKIVPKQLVHGKLLKEFGNCREIGG